MKLTEAIQLRQPLFESFKDLKGIIERDIENVGVNELAMSLEGFESSYMDMKEAEGEEQYFINYNDSRNIVNAIKDILQHDLSKTDLDDVMRETKNVNGASRTSLILNLVTQEAMDITVRLSDPARQEPDSEVVKSSSNYVIVQLNNYSAARKLCNDYNTNFCIGSSDTEAFDEYGRIDGKDTFAIITGNRRVVIVHTGNDGYRITGHDNEDEVKDTSRFDTQEMEAIVADLSPPIPMNEVHDVLNEVIDPQYHGDVKEKVFQFSRAYMSPEDKDTRPILEDYGMFGDFNTEVSLRKSPRNFYLHCFTIIEDSDGTFSEETTDFMIKDGEVGVIGGFGFISVGDPTAILSEDLHMNIFEIGRIIDKMKDSDFVEAFEMGKLFEQEM